MSCEHVYVRRRWWWLHRVSWHRWECLHCQERTRTYDTADLWATRPIHPHMTVAFPGYNTAKRILKSVAF